MAVFGDSVKGLSIGKTIMCTLPSVDRMSWQDGDSQISTRPEAHSVSFGARFNETVGEAVNLYNLKDGIHL